MPLIDMTSDLTSLRFGRDRRGGGDSGQPYFTKDIPERLQSINFATSFLGNDFLVRGGVASTTNVLDDSQRLTKFLTSFNSPNGALFVAKQQLLARHNPLTGAGPDRFYLPTNTLAQAAVNPIGIHFMKDGKKLKLNEKEKYASLAKDQAGYNTSELGLENRNKLLLLFESKIITPTIDPIPPVNDIDQAVEFGYQTGDFSGLTVSTNNLATAVEGQNQFRNNLGLFGISTDRTLIQSYQGGPNSTLGGKTQTRRVEFTDKGIVDNRLITNVNNRFILYTPDLIIQRGSSKYNTGFSNFGGAGLSNFQTKFKQQDGREATGATVDRVNELIGNPTDYSRFNRVQTYGDPSTAKIGPGGQPRDRSVYYTTDPKNISNEEINKIYRPDSVNATPLYSTAEESANDEISDLIKFNIGVLDLDSTGATRNTTWLHFRAYISNFSDSYQGSWNPVKYMGRGNNFYKYDGYTRDINMDFRVVVHSKYEQAFLYDKLNYLASAIAPNYSAGGFMRGNLVKLTVGDYLNNTVGILNGISFSIPEESPWDIGRDLDGKLSDKSLQLPFIIDVGGFKFTPIHNFIDKTIDSNYITEGKAKPDQRYISLGPEGRGYQFTQAKRKEVNNVQSET